MLSYVLFAAVTQLEILAATVWGLKWAQPIAEFVAFVSISFILIYIALLFYICTSPFRAMLYVFADSKISPPPSMKPMLAYKYTFLR